MKYILFDHIELIYNLYRDWRSICRSWIYVSLEYSGGVETAPQEFIDQQDGYAILMGKIGNLYYINIHKINYKEPDCNKKSEECNIKNVWNVLGNTQFYVSMRQYIIWTSNLRPYLNDNSLCAKTLYNYKFYAFVNGYLGGNTYVPENNEKIPYDLNKEFSIGAEFERPNIKKTIIISIVSVLAGCMVLACGVCYIRHEKCPRAVNAGSDNATSEGTASAVTGLEGN